MKVIQIFKHADFTFGYPSEWSDFSRLILTHSTDHSNVQVGKMSPGRQSVEHHMGVYCSRVLSDLKPLKGRITVENELAHDRYSGKTYEFEFYNDTSLWIQLHNLVVASKGVYTFVLTAKKPSYESLRPQFDETC